MKKDTSPGRNSSCLPALGDKNEALLGCTLREKPRRVFLCQLWYQILPNETAPVFEKLSMRFSPEMAFRLRTSSRPVASRESLLSMTASSGQQEKLLGLSNFFFCHYVFKTLSAAEASESVHMRERVNMLSLKQIEWISCDSVGNLLTKL